MDATRRIVAGWILEERLGSGGFGEVWKARRRHVDVFRALKLVPVSSESTFAGWRHEINRLEDLSHPNIVRFYDADIVADDGPYQDCAWIATELCDHSLADEIERRGGRPLSPAEATALLDAMLGALAAAHSQGCVHRDVKPANILLHHSGVWKLCDFGTARLIPSGESHPRTAVVGTFPYMSPAAHRGRQDQAADLYALGVTIHEALCGRRLHPRPQGMTDSEYVKFILDTPPVIAPDLDPPWHEVISALIGDKGPYTAADVLQQDWFASLPRPTGIPPGVTQALRAPTVRITPSRQPEAPRTQQYPRSPTARPSQSRPPTRTPPPRTPSSTPRRRPEPSPEGRHIAGIFALFATSVVVAGLLLYQLIASALLVAGIVGAVLLATLLVMALS